MPYDLAALDRIEQRFVRRGTSLFVETYNMDTLAVLDSFEFTNAPQALPSEVALLASRRLLDLVSPAGTITGDGGINIAGTLFYPVTEMTAATMLALSPSSYTGRTVRLTDVNRAVYESTGTRWRPQSGRAVIGSLDTDWTGVAGASEQIVWQRTLPAGLLRNGDTLFTTGGFGKSGASETCTVQLRIGAAGTTADTSIIATAPLATTNVSYGMYLEFRRNTATSMQRSLSGATQNPLGATTSARGSATTLASSLDSVNQFLTLTMTQSSTVEVPSAWGFRVEHIAGA